MLFKHLLTIAAAASAAFSATALDITTATAGTLEQELGDGSSISTLKVDGPINAIDFDFITHRMPALTGLDLSGAVIEAVGNAHTTANITEYNANELPPYAFFGSKITSVALPQGITAIGEAAFGKCAISAIEIPAAVTTVGNYAFTGCPALKEITLPAAVTSVGDGAFKDCTALETAVIQSNIEAIAPDMFNGCTLLADVQLPSSCKQIGNGAFENCTSLQQIAFPAALVTIGDKAFYNSGLTSLSLDACKSLLSAGDFAFAKCSGLADATFGNSGAALGKGLFFDDSALQMIQLPASTTVIPSFTFKGTASIDATTAIPAVATEIGDYALTGWNKVTEFTLPAGITHLGDGAMEGWTALEILNVVALPDAPTLGNEVWRNVDQPNTTLSVSNSNIEAFEVAPQWKDFKISLYTSVDDIVDDITGSGNKTKVDFNVGDGCLRIASHGADIAAVSIYDLSGRARYGAAPDAATVMINTMQWRGSVIIASVTLADGSVSSVKLVL